MQNQSQTSSFVDLNNQGKSEEKPQSLLDKFRTWFRDFLENAE